MGIELPAELAEIAQRTGAKWPEADEDAMRAQAGAWRDAAGKVGSLAADADGSAHGALGAMRGQAGDAARNMWKGFVDPDKGSLTSAARRAGRAADRLEHAAGQVADAKVEMVRQLTDAAKNYEAANAAANGGHPTALLGLDSLLGGVSTNLASVTDSLVGAVGAVGAVGDTGRVLGTGELVKPNPGAQSARGQNGLLGAVTGLGSEVLSTVSDTAGGAVDTARGVADTAVREVGETAVGAVREVGEVGEVGVREVADTAVREVGETAVGAVREVGETHGGAVREMGEVGEAAGRAVREVGNAAGVDVSPTAPTPPSGIGLGAVTGGGSFAEAPTPPSGIGLGPGVAQRIPHVPGGTSVAGFTDAPAPAAAAGLPPAGALPGAAPQAAPGPFAGGQFGAPIGGAPAGAAAPGAPGAPAGGAPAGGPVAGGHAQAGQQAPRADRGAPPVRNIGAFSEGAGGQAVKEPRQLPRPPAQGYLPYAPPPQPHQPFPPQQQPSAQTGYGLPRKDRASIVALFLVHMFPIGHLPVARGEPARQLPVPPPEADFSPGLRFEPHDHPESHTIDPALALGRVWTATPAPPGLHGLPTDHPAVAGLLDRYDPLADLHERDWERRYLVRPGSNNASAPEYAWPPGERYPEGGCEDGEAVMLEPGVVVDRFGAADGRVFAEDATPFRARALSPAHVDAGYHRYRVLRDLPMWRARSASWFGQPGGGVRMRAVYSAAELVALGYLEELAAPEPDTTRTKVEPEETQSGDGA